MSRREWLRAGFLGRAADVAARKIDDAAKVLSDAGFRDSDPASMPPRAIDPARPITLALHRPPGAIPEQQFLAGCTRCDACIKACPQGVIVRASGRFRGAEGTPVLDLSIAACVMCEDTPCVTACKPGVLKAQRPRKMGTAWVQPMACLAHTGSFCTVCSERCPVPGAIEVRQGKPIIHESACTGCGVCVNVCPAPSKAILVMPLTDRPPDAPAAESDTHASPN